MCFTRVSIFLWHEYIFFKLGSVLGELVEVSCKTLKKVKQREVWIKLNLDDPANLPLVIMVETDRDVFKLGVKIY